MAALSGIIDALGRASRMGAGDSMDPRRAKRIVLSNQISISIALLCLPYVLIYLFHGAGIMGWLEIPIFLGYACVHRINRAGFTWFSRFWLITLANLDILIYTISLGRSTSQHIFLLAAGIAPLALFNAEEKWSIIYGVVLSTLLLAGTEAFAPEIGMFEPIVGDGLHGMRVVQMVTLCIVQSLLIFYFFHGNRKTEMALALARDSAKEADQAKSLFLDKMSGEIRAPLNEILGLSHLLLKSGLGAERRETLEDIQVSTQDLMTIVDEILDLSRIESGRMRLEAAPFSPLRLGHAVLRPFEFEAGRKGLELSLEAQGELPSHLIGDSARLKQVLRNLLGNAFKFTETGRIILRIGAATPTEEAADPQTLRFEIEDTGIGVPEAARARIFEPFSQADASTTRKYGGTGLGLFISKQIVEMMGGAIGLRPRPGGGTVFHFHVALRRVPESYTADPESGESETPSSTAPSPTVPPPAVPTPAAPYRRAAADIPSASFNPGPRSQRPEAAIPASAQALRILVVDDHPLNRKVLESFIGAYGLSVDVAASAEDALAACERAYYHLIFMDCHMPGMDGYECTRRLRQGPRAGARPTIIGVTADAMDNNLRRCLDAGMDTLMVKPIVERQLRNLIAECAESVESPGSAGRVQGLPPAAG
jgi:signal transduction histidine kinase